ncbi:IucA/IucC family C-terminal-domain containing protein [Paenibacillus ehimensis]|uniref:IucA/IucC family C-terminal-domain containing protein n=1 Tax=Paenibacillus ehimensis TaxID=79264 RepID=UPI003D29DD60
MKRLTSFDAEQSDYLAEEFHLSVDRRPEPARSVPVTDLLDEAACGAYLDAVTSLILSPSRMVTASAFSKRYAFLTIAPVLYAMTMYNKGLDLTMDRCAVPWPDDTHGSWLPGIILTTARVTEPAAGRRAEWREETISTLFSGHIAPLFRSLSKAAAVPISILWENAAVRLYSLYEKRIGEGAVSGEDFAYLIHAAPARLFGETRNPLARFYGTASRRGNTSSPARTRATCCFYYEVGSSDGSYCSNCPKAL